MNLKMIFSTIIISITVLIGCKEKPQSSIDQTEPVDTLEVSQNDEIVNSEGYKLMSQKCFICHFQIPDPARKDQMLAPPFLRVQEHYKPAYPEKEEFIKAVVSIVNEPSEENTLMPGAIKKFNIMPKLVYDQNELRLIAETLYDMNYESVPKMRMQMMHSNLQLNNGEKWKIKKESVKQMNSVIQLVNAFNSENIDDFNNLGKVVFNNAKKIMLDKSYEGELFDQIHAFFYSIEGNMHTLMAIRSLDEAKKQLNDLRKKLNDFNNYFEAE